MNASMEGGVAIVLCLVGAWDGWSNGRSVGGMRLERHNWGNMSDGRIFTVIVVCIDVHCVEGSVVHCVEGCRNTTQTDKKLV